MLLNPVRAAHKALGEDAWQRRAQHARGQLYVAKTPMQAALAAWKIDTYAAARVGAAVATPARGVLGEGSARHVEQLITSMAGEQDPPEPGSAGLVNWLGFALHQCMAGAARGLLGPRAAALDAVFMGLRRLVALPCGIVSLAAHASCVAGAALIGAAYGLLSGVRARSHKPSYASEAALARLQKVALADGVPRRQLPARVKAVAQAGSPCKFIMASRQLLDSETKRLRKRFGAADKMADVLKNQSFHLGLDATHQTASFAALTALWNAERDACNNALDLLMKHIDAMQPIAMAMPHWQASALPMTLPNWVPQGQPITVRTPKELEAMGLFYHVTLDTLCTCQHYLSKVGGKLATTAELLKSAARGSAGQPTPATLPTRRLSTPVRRAPGVCSASA